MKQEKFIIFLIALLLGCEEAQVLENEVKVGVLKNEKGVRLATFGPDSSVALVIVDSSLDLVSIHCLNPGIDPGAPELMMNPADLRTIDDATTKKFSDLLRKRQHPVIICKITDDYHGVICCTMLENSQSIYKGTASLLLEHAFPIEDTLYVPKVYSFSCDISGQGTVIDIVHQNAYKYTMNACIYNIKSHPASIRVMNYIR